MRFDAEGSVGSAQKADMESGSESASDSGSREKVLVTELKHDIPVREGWNPTLMNGIVTVRLYIQTSVIQQLYFKTCGNHDDLIVAFHFHRGDFGGQELRELYCGAEISR